jgi:DNA-3-methyladenine glycosylase
MPDTPLLRAFYDRDSLTVARELLGLRLVRVSREGVTSGRIVETEAYRATDDPANHGHRGMTRRNASMFGPPGHAYVYAIHARYCFNVVTEGVGVASAVLIRAVEPERGEPLMFRRRGMDKRLNLTSGPAKLCEAFAMDRALDAWDLTRAERLWITMNDTTPIDDADVVRTTRIGVSSGEDLPLRFYIASNPFVSRRARVRKNKTEH